MRPVADDDFEISSRTRLIYKKESNKLGVASSNETESYKFLY